MKILALSAAAFIKNGRQTIQGIHYVHGQKIADSPFRSDPVNPIHESELARIIQEQSQRKTKIATLAEIRRGPEALKAFVERSKQECSYLIFDGETQDDLKIIAAAVHQEKNLPGAAADWLRNWPFIGGTCAAAANVPDVRNKNDDFSRQSDAADAQADPAV